ncbi:MAG: hypothetical protein KME59_06750 [Trichormus sp. ATA11-4-KO1]|jgi:hypothetical protein|nr:hypothetical protein [Trichormus sp. ATA11-4-KO1]
MPRDQESLIDIANAIRRSLRYADGVFSLYLCAFAPLREINSYFQSATPKIVGWDVCFKFFRK